jgi:type IX secretion system PorP/SprF family membrane protein
MFRSTFTSCTVYVLLILALPLAVVKGQDPLFSQFFAIPNALNPGLSGAFDGKYRVSGVYRDQWRSVMEEPFSSFGLGLDLRFDMDSKGFNKDFFGVSLGFQTDKSGFIEYSLNQMWLGAAFHKSVGKNQFLGGGFNLGMNQRNINYSRINFQDQFNGIDGYTLPTLENLPENNFAHGDLSIGINYLNSFNKRLSYNIGLAVHHVLGMENSFFKLDSRTEINNVANSYKLPARFTAYLGMNIQAAELLDVQPRALISSQGSTLNVILGTNFKFGFLNSDNSTFTMGPYLRMAAGANTWSSDMLGMLVGYGYENMFIGMSYDFSINTLSRFGRSRGSFELSISYFGLYENNDIFCPAF